MGVKTCAECSLPDQVDGKVALRARSKGAAVGCPGEG